MSDVKKEWPLWEVFVRSKAGLDHKHCGSLHAADPQMAIQLARDVYTRRQEDTSVWASAPTRSSPATWPTRAAHFDPMADKVYRRPTFDELPRSLDDMWPPDACKPRSTSRASPRCSTCFASATPA